VSNSLLFYNRQFPAIIFHALRVLHACFRVANFKETCQTEHGLSSFKVFATESVGIFKDNFENNEVVTNVCAASTAFVDAFPEETGEYRGIIPDLIKIASERIDVVRKNAAVLIAKLCRDEENAKVMRANHGTEVLVSLRGVLNN